MLFFNLVFFILRSAICILQEEEVCSLNSRERLLVALNHREPDRVPIDLGGTPTSTISARAHENLKAHLGIQSPTRMMSSIFLTAYPDEEVVRKFGVDVKMVAANPPAGFELHPTPEGRIGDEWGVVYQWHEEAQTHFVVEPEAPLHRVTTPEEVEKHPWPDPSDPSRYRGLKETARRYQQDGYAVVVSTPLMVMTQTPGMRGLEQFMVDTVLNPSLLEYMMDKILGIQLEMTRRLLEEIDPYMDVIVIGDDLSHQGGLTYSPDMYRRLFKPRHRKIMRVLKEEFGDAKVLYHCCGGVEPLLPDLIDLGIDAINPLQVSAGGMGDTKKLKAKYGRHLTFWGGIDTQRILPFGTPAEVRNEVRRRIEDLADGGGLVLAAVHNIRPEVKPANICALFEAALEFGKYSRKSGPPGEPEAWKTVNRSKRIEMGTT
jgi:uroporphyrinogen decarboxylase